jgi:exonuclease VII large subunit
VDKVVEVSGRVVSIETEKENMHVFLHNADYEIQCTLQNSENERAKNLKEGDSVLLKAKFDGYLEDDMFGKQVKMSNAILVKKY